MVLLTKHLRQDGLKVTPQVIWEIEADDPTRRESAGEQNFRRYEGATFSLGDLDVKVFTYTRTLRHSIRRIWITGQRIPNRNSRDRKRQFSSRIKKAFPFLQRWIPATCRQRSRSDTFDLQYFVGPTIDSESHARASVTVVPVCLHPLLIFKRRPVPTAFNLVSALRSDGPFGLPVVQPNIGGGRIYKPAATRFELLDRRSPGRSGLSIYNDDSR